MNKTLITGATGQLGRSIIKYLLTLVPATEVVALARDPAKASDLSALGIEIRRGDYTDPASLLRAFAGVDKLMFISTVMFPNGIRQHENVVNAAKAAGVRHVHYTAIQRAKDSTHSISQVTELDAATERALAASGLAVTILRKTMYFDALPFMLGDHVLDAGLRITGGARPAALAARDELAEAAAIVLAGRGHEGRTYTLSGSEAVFMTEIAGILSNIAGKQLDVFLMSSSDFAKERAALGMPLPAAQFVADWFHAIGAGEFSDMTGDLARLLGRKPLTAKQFLPGIFAVAAAAR